MFGLIASTMIAGCLATIDGRLEEAAQTARGMLTRAEETGHHRICWLLRITSWMPSLAASGEGRRSPSISRQDTLSFQPPCEALYLALSGTRRRGSKNPGAIRRQPVPASARPRMRPRPSTTFFIWKRRCW